jgi:hypothetical protein
MAAVEDYRCWADRKEERMEHDNGCISDDDESHKKDTEWSFVDQDGRPAFGRQPRAILPHRGLVEWKYARPEPPRNQDDVDQLAGSKESNAEERIWDSTVKMYVESDTDEEEGSPEEEADVSGEGLSDIESIDQLGDQNSCCLEGSRGRQDEVFSQEEVLSGVSDSLPVIRITRKRDQTGTNTTIRVPLRKRAGTGGKEKKRSRFH